jgi:hypothetical protein
MKTTNLLSLVSAAVLTIFIVLAFGSSIPTDVEHLGDGVYRKTYITYNPLISEFGHFAHEGPRDQQGRWHGEVKAMIGDRLAVIRNLKNGKLHGEQVYYNRDGSIKSHACYINGSRQEEMSECDDIGKRISDPIQSKQSDYVLSGTTTSQNINFSEVEKFSRYNYQLYEYFSYVLEAYNKDTLKSIKLNNAVYRILASYNARNTLNSSRRTGYKKLGETYSSENSEVRSFGYLEYESPWFIFLMEHYDFDSTQVKAYLADIEDHISGLAPADETEFTDTYIEVLDIVSENHEISDAHQFIAEIEVSEGIKSFELRLAVIDRYLNYGESTFQILGEKYPEFLARLNEGVEEDEIISFTDDLDSRMDSEEPFDIEDPFLAEEIEARLFLKIDEMIDEEVHTSVIDGLLFIFLEMAAQADPVHEAVKAAYFEDPVHVDPVKEMGIPKRVSLEQNYPNPFNPSTTISYSIHEQLHSRLQVFDVTGKEIATLVDEIKNPGTYEVIFNASHLPSGVYVYRLQAGEYVESRKLMLLK